MKELKPDPKRYEKLMDAMKEKYPPLLLPSEYAEYVQNNLLRMLILLARYKFVAKLIKHTDDVLEVGSGCGLGTLFLGQHAARVTGLEMEEYEFNAAQSINRRKNVTFKHCDYLAYTSRRKYDAIVALDVIEHMPVKKGEQLIAATAKHLKTSGMAVIGTPSIYSYKYQGDCSRAAHVKCYDQKELVKMVEARFRRVLAFSMNDEIVHTGHPKMAWYYFVLGFLPKNK